MVGCMADIDRKKQLLDRRLANRPEKQDLIQRGIIPAGNASPTIAAQATHLQRVKTGSSIQQKIKFRPSKQQLIQQNILPAGSFTDPSLLSCQEVLRRSQLKDHLNEQLLRRPGVLELVQNNILNLGEPISHLVQNGDIKFVPSCNGMETIDGYYSEGAGFESDTMSPVHVVDAVEHRHAPRPSSQMSSFSYPDYVSHASFGLVCSSGMVSEGLPVLGLIGASRQLDQTPLLPVPFRPPSIHNVPSEQVQKKPKGSRQRSYKTTQTKVKTFKYHEYKPPGALAITSQPHICKHQALLIEQQTLYLQLTVLQQQQMQQQPSSSSSSSSSSGLETVSDINSALAHLKGRLGSLGSSTTCTCTCNQSNWSPETDPAATLDQPGNSPNSGTQLPPPQKVGDHGQGEGVREDLLQRVHVMLSQHCPHGGSDGHHHALESPPAQTGKDAVSTPRAVQSHVRTKVSDCNGPYSGLLEGLSNDAVSVPTSVDVVGRYWPSDVHPVTLSPTKACSSAAQQSGGSYVSVVSAVPSAVAQQRSGQSTGVVAGSQTKGFVPGWLSEFNLTNPDPPVMPDRLRSATNKCDVGLSLEVPRQNDKTGRCGFQATFNHTENHFMEVNHDYSMDTSDDQLADYLFGESPMALTDVAFDANCETDFGFLSLLQ